jgi:NADPH:quinone reductase-like Zn-dependent oxidoreductase
MKAIVYERYGGPEVLELREVPRPEPRDNELLIRIRATTVTAGDWRARSLKLPPGFGLMGRLVFGIFGPRKKILGTELSGDVVAVGRGVTKFKVGDAVFALTGARYGAYAEYIALREDAAIALKPANISYEEAAALSFGGTTALHFFRLAELKAGETVLINGASSGVGVAAVQLARHFGAHVTAVTSGGNAELVRSLGAERVIDYTREDFRTLGEQWDVVVETVGNISLENTHHTLRSGGRLLVVVGTFADMFKGGKAKKLGVKLVAGATPERPEDLRTLAELAASGAYLAVIDRSYRMEEIVEAHRYVDTGRKRGSVVITVQNAAPEEGPRVITAAAQETLGRTGMASRGLVYRQPPASDAASSSGVNAGPAPAASR